ncbi:30S ribosomal protein S12 methylthiotransferase RimO [candidate division KSB3 bacterium]|uniref:Ribosomal protein uS12 methylthiotransferase RimO n=1 Tax=candidate division KSB3 bacterium TaxID=2044937 RepID=A0A2G6K8U9_9BACT|nr:MAG: 30S ribosomal protein S12 methylthiotransferase RimO [candidate division KSB3 bacterium]
MTTVGCISLGCPKNRLDSEIMLGLLEQAGYTIVPEDEADILLVNTCGFIQEAKEEAIQTTLEAAEYKEHGACRLLIMAGCFSQRYVYDLAGELPEVDCFIGLDDVPNIVEICRQLEQQQAKRIARQVARATPSTYLYDHTLPRFRFGPRHTAYVKISEGCRYRCSFCAIPLMRGRLRSRPMESIVEEVNMLGDQGTQELVLIAQDTTSYGSERTGQSQIVPLLKRLAGLNAVPWIRLMYAYPTNFDRNLMRLIATTDSICRYIDLPLQHIDNRILKAMRRSVTEAQTWKLLEQLRIEIPNLTLRTSLIVGFPGETDEAFQKLECFVREVEFDRLGVFTYSHEEGTAAYELPDLVPAEIAEERRQRLMAIQEEIALKKNQTLVGTVQTVLVDGVSEETELLLEARTEGQAPDIDGVVYINEGNTEHGVFERVLITEAFSHDLVGRVLENDDVESHIF